MYETHFKWVKLLLFVLISMSLLLFEGNAGEQEKEWYSPIVEDICEQYEIDYYLVSAIIEHETNWDPDLVNGRCIGLMQIDTYWHNDRAEDLGITDWYDPESNILLGVDLLSYLFETYEDYELVVMLYSTSFDDAFWYHEQGLVESSAQEIINLAEELREESL